MPHDHVHEVLEQWRHELPKLDRAPMGVIGRISRLAHGLITRTGDPRDARSKQVTLTLEGVRLTEEAVAAHTANEARPPHPSGRAAEADQLPRAMAGDSPTSCVHGPWPGETGERARPEGREPSTAARVGGNCWGMSRRDASGDSPQPRLRETWPSGSDALRDLEEALGPAVD